MEEIKKQLLAILNDIHAGEDFENCHNLIDSGILDSFDLITFISEISEEFDVIISADKILPENFNSVDAMAKLVYGLIEED